MVPLYSRYTLGGNTNDELRWYLIRKTNGRCAYCGSPFRSNRKGGIAADIDHIVPRTQNGSDHHSNLILSCRSCNSSKGSKTLNDFRRYKDVDKFYFETVDHGPVLTRLKFTGEETAMCSIVISYDHQKEMESVHFSGDLDCDKEVTPIQRELEEFERRNESPF